MPILSQLQAGTPVIPDLTSSGQGQTRSEHAQGCYGNPVYYGDEYYFYFMGKPGKRYQGTQLGIRLSRRDTAQQKNNRDKFIYTVESARVPGMGLGESYTGLSGDVRTPRRLLVKRP